MPYSFAAHLLRFGPGANFRTPDLAQARSYCARLTRTHYENFSVASALLPRRLVPHFYPVYAYCRWADDLGDETGGGQTALDLLAWWRGELLDLYSGRVKHPVMVALQPTIERFKIPAQPFLDLLNAFEQDQVVKRYATYDELLNYCVFSANPVGRLVLYLCESFDEIRAGLSDCICTGLQLANFWQDIRRDYAELGRIYLPQEDCTRFGVSDDDLRERRCTPAFRDLMKFEVDRAQQLFQRGRPLLEMIPPDVRPDIQLFLEGGLAILHKIEAAGYDVLSARPKLSKRDKASLVLGALADKFVRPGPFTNSMVPVGNAHNAPARCAPPVHFSFQWCHRLTKKAARNFYFAFQVLPRAQRKAMEALYAFMRVTDDLADEPGEIPSKRQALKQWRLALDRTLAGDCPNPNVRRAFQPDAATLAGNDAHLLLPALDAIVKRYRIPPQHLHEVIDGVETDLEPVGFKTFDEMYAYCYRVASAVGLSCIHIWGFHDAKAKEHAEAAGIAFQLTNILRDLGEDLDRGRVYLPQDEIERFGCPPESWRQLGAKALGFREMMRFQVERARDYYRQGQRLSHYLDPSGRAVFQVMMRIYQGLLEEIAHRNYDVFEKRVHLSKWRKLRYLFAAFPTKWGWAAN